MSSNLKEEKTVTPFFIPGKAGQLEVLAVQPRENSQPKVVIVCHPHPLYGGTMNNKVVTTLHRVFRDKGIVTVRFNFRGVGKSEGQYDEGIGEKEDLLAVIHWIRERYPEYRLILAGFSFGAYIATTVTSTLPEVSQLVTISPPVNHFELKSCTPILCPWVIVQGIEDEIVSTPLLRKFVQALDPTPNYIEIANANHFFHGKLIELYNHLYEVI